MSGVKFSNTTPAAPSGMSLVKFQSDGQGNVSAAYAGDLLTVTCGENINAYQGVVVRADGLAYKADAATVADAPRFIGVAETSATTGNTITVRAAGVMHNLGFSFTPGSRVYVGLSGALTQSLGVGTFELPIGLAISAVDLDIIIGTPIIY